MGFNLSTFTPSLSHRMSNASKILSLLLSLFLIGCATKPYADPIKVMLDASRPGSSRLRALNQINQQSQTTPLPATEHKRYLKSLHGLVWNDSHPLPLRQRATELLIAQNQQAFLESANDLITIVDQWNMIIYLLDLAKQNRWQSFTIAATHSWARPSTLYPDDSRPERDLIQILNPTQSPRQTLLQILTGNYRGTPPTNRPISAMITTKRHEIAAWLILSRITKKPDLYAALAAADRNSQISQDLHTIKQSITHLPSTREGLLWTNYLLHNPTPLGSPDTFTDLNPAEPYWQNTLHIRHLPVAIRHLRSKAPNPTSQTIRTHLVKHPPHLRTDHPHPQEESFDLQLPKLAPADLLVIQNIIQATHSLSVRQTLFAQADRDLKDTTSELGGVLTWDQSNQYIAQPFPPEIRAHDRKFYASNQLIESMYTGLAHYHFHAQKHNNQQFAAPGQGDQKFADRLGTHAVVFTFIDANTLNVDYYQPGNIVIDLGTITRP